jgi:hypothetical protein
MDPEAWMYYFEQANQAAKDGRHLPTLEDLCCGMSFFYGSVAADAREWAERTIPKIAEKGQKVRRNQVQLVLERLTVSAGLEDLKFVHKKIVQYKALPEMFGELSRAARRLVLYRVLSGDESVRLSLLSDLIYRIRWLTCKAGGSGHFWKSSLDERYAATGIGHGIISVAGDTEVEEGFGKVMSETMSVANLLIEFLSHLMQAVLHKHFGDYMRRLEPARTGVDAPKGGTIFIPFFVELPLGRNECRVGEVSST